MIYEGLIAMTMEGRSVIEKLRPLFYPKSIAVIGASDNPMKLGYLHLRGIIEFGYEGAVYPVNPRLAGKEILGLKCYAKVSDIPDDIDLVYIAVNARNVVDVLKDCVKKGVKAAIIFAGGFAEIGDEGRMMEEEIRAIARKSGMVVLGPNCLGVANLYVNLNTLGLGASLLKPPEPGRISLISHSGTLTVSFLTLSTVRKFYPSKIASTGNEATTTLTDILEYFIEDPDTGVIAMYIESIRNGKRFIELCKSTTKPLVALKAGRSESGKSAAKSHTAALAGSIEVWNAVCKQAGIIQAESFEELYELSMTLACSLRPKGNRVGIISVLGGPAVIACDACERYGLKVPLLTKESIEKLKAILPPIASVTNPVDTTGSILENMDMYREALEIMCRDPNIDMIIALPPIIHAPSFINISRAIVESSRRYGKPIIVAWALPLGVRMQEFEQALEILGKGLVPNCYMPERAAKMAYTLLAQAMIEGRKRSRGSLR
ncbi:MAG: CoA-binding protein [Candidatus Nezhaarchaeales archaeon]